jgi:hypothetical protein
MPLSNDTLTLLSQIPLAGIVVVVVGLFLWFLRDWAKSEREARQSESEADRSARVKEQSVMRDFIAVQNELFLIAVKEIREQNNAALARLAEEVKANTLRLGDINNGMIELNAKSNTGRRSPK